MTSTKNDQFCDKFCDNFFPKSLLYESQTKWVDTNEKRKKPWIYHKMLKKEGNKKLGTHFGKVNRFGVGWEGACFTGKTSLGRPSYKLINEYIVLEKVIAKPSQNMRYTSKKNCKLGIKCNTTTS